MSKLESHHPTDCETAIWMERHSQPQPERVPVLVVCPNEASRHALEKLLCPPSFRMLLAENADEAAAVLRKTHVPVVIAGCSELAREALQSRHKQPSPRVILLGDAFADDLEGEPFDIVAVPIARDELLWAVTDAWLDWRRELALTSEPTAKAIARSA